VVSEDDDPQPAFRVVVNEEPEENSGELNREKMGDEGETRVADEALDAAPVNS
jgi:hypothetical protein